MVRYAATHWLQMPLPYDLQWTVFNDGNYNARVCLGMFSTLACPGGRAFWPAGKGRVRLAFCILKHHWAQTL